MTKSIAKKSTTGSLPPAVPLAITPTFSPWTHTSDDSYIYQLSLVLATAIVSFLSFLPTPSSAPSRRATKVLWILILAHRTLCVYVCFSCPLCYACPAKHPPRFTGMWVVSNSRLVLVVAFSSRPPAILLAVRGRCFLCYAFSARHEPPARGAVAFSFRVV